MIRMKITESKIVELDYDEVDVDHFRDLLMKEAQDSLNVTFETDEGTYEYNPVQIIMLEVERVG